MDKVTYWVLGQTDGSVEIHPAITKILSEPFPPHLQVLCIHSSSIVPPTGLISAHAFAEFLANIPPETRYELEPFQATR